MEGNSGVTTSLAELEQHNWSPFVQLTEMADKDHFSVWAPIVDLLAPKYCLM
jgi:hypothetical protein